MSYKVPGSPKSWVAACLCAAALAAALLCPTATRRARAHGGGVQADNNWRVLPPIGYKNLTLFPIEAADAGRTDAYVTLDEGLKAGTVVITERGASAASRRTRRRVLPGNNAQARQVQTSAGGGDDASVNELTLVNRSGRKLLLLAGEVIVGGKQDRIVEEDLIIPPVSVPVSLSVFCVEHGRWSQRAAAPRPSAPGGSGVGAGPTRHDNFSSLGAISHPKLRAAAQDKKLQGEVWKEVQSNNVKLGTVNRTDTYQEVYANKEVSAGMDEYIAALRKEMPTKNIVGVVVARGGELVWVDAFSSASLFAKYWPKLLKSYVVDALGEPARAERPTVEQAREYLRQRDGKRAADGRPGVYRLVKTEHPRYALFQLEDISLAAPLRVHFNKMQR